MAKKLLSILAAASMIASAAVNLTVVSADGGINVTDCNVANGAENVNTAAIVLTFDENVTKDDLAEAVKINGQSDNFTMDVKDNKAQLAIKGVTKNTNYTLSVDESDNETFTRSFKTGNTLYTSDWSQIGTNADRVHDEVWAGTYKEVIGENNYIKISDEKRFNYSLESAASKGILEIEYERYLPSKLTDEEGNPTETDAQHIAYGLGDSLFFDNGKTAVFRTVNHSATPRISSDAWHTYKYVINFTTKSIVFYLDGVKTELDDKSSDLFTDTTYVKDIQFSVGGGLLNREQWIRNIRAVRRNYVGSWWNNQLTEVSGETKWTLNNTGTTKQERYYALNPKTTGDSAKISFEIKFNDALKTLGTDKAAEWGNTSIRLSSNNGNQYHTICYPFSKPSIDYWTDSKVIFNLPEGVDSLEANKWHKYEFVYDFDKVNNKRILKYATVDGAVTICNSESDNAYVDYINFFVCENNALTLDEKPVWEIKDINVIDNYSTENITVTSNVPESGLILPENLKLTFSSPITKESLDSFKVYNEDGNTVSGCTFKLDEKTQQTVTLEMSNYNLNANYEVGVIDAKGYLGGSCEEQKIPFTTPSHGKITGKWTDKWWTNGTGTSMTQNDDGSVTFNVVNDKKDYEGSGDYQSHRKSFAYSFDQTVTGTDVPLTIKYSFKVNDALTKSPSLVRFYGAEKTQEYCFNVSKAYSSLMYDDWYSYNKANMPEGVTGVTPNEWHTVEYAINVNSTTGSTLKYMVYDDVITYTSTTDGAPMLNVNLKGIQNIDFWFYSTTATEDNYELQIKDLSVTKGASSFDITATNAELTADNNKIHLEFVNPVNETALGTVKVMSGVSVVDNAITAYTLSADGRSADITIADLATGKYTLSFASLTDVYGKTSETNSFDFTYTAAAQEGIVEIKSASASEATADGVTNVNVSVKLSNGTFSAVSGKLIAAAYNSDNKLVGIGIEDASNLTVGDTDISKTVTFKKPTESYSSIKVMLWDGLNTMKALCESANAVLSVSAN